MKRFLLYMVIFLHSHQAFSDSFDMTLTRKSNNIYKVLGKDAFIQTRYCYEYAYGEGAIVNTSGGAGEIMFTRSGNRCDIKNVFSHEEIKAGTYQITVSRDEYDLYHIEGGDSYVKTSLCLELSLSEKAFLVVTDDGGGYLHINQRECMIDGIYSKVKM